MLSAALGNRDLVKINAIDFIKVSASADGFNDRCGGDGGEFIALVFQEE